MNKYTEKLRKWTGIPELKLRYMALAFLIQLLLFGWPTFAIGIGIGWAIAAMIQQIVMDRREYYKKHPQGDPPRFQKDSLIFTLCLNYAFFGPCIYVAWKHFA